MYEELGLAWDVIYDDKKVVAAGECDTIKQANREATTVILSSYLNGLGGVLESDELFYGIYDLTFGRRDLMYLYRATYDGSLNVVKIFDYIDCCLK